MAHREIDGTGTLPDRPKRTRKRRSEAERQDILSAIAVATDIGVSRERMCAALDVPTSTVDTWISQGELDAIRNGTSGCEYRGLKASIVEHLAQLAAEGSALLRRCYSSCDPKGAKDTAISLGIILDKLLLGTGQATSRTERVSTDDRGNLSMYREAMRALGVQPHNKPNIIDAEYTIKDECSKTRA